MSFQKFESNSFFVGGRHHSSKVNIVGEITFNKKLVEKLNFWLDNVLYAVDKNQWW